MGLLVTFLVYRGPKWKKSNFVLLSFFNLCLIAVSLDPGLANVITQLLSIAKFQHARLFALIIISIVFLVFFSFYTRSKLENMRQQLDLLIRGLIVKDLEKYITNEKVPEPIMVLIPAYNEAPNLKELLLEIPEQIGSKKVGVIVVDDGSTDETEKVVKNAGPRYFVVKSSLRRGGGAALRLGYEVLKTLGPEIVVTMDADGQHQPEEIERLVAPILKNTSEFVIGSRILGNREKDSPIRYAGLHLFNFVISLLMGAKITDCSSGFRAFKGSVLSTFDLREDQYHTSEAIIDAVKKGVNICEVPVTMSKRRHGNSKKGNDWRYALNFGKAVLKTWWR